ncbi:hypothetical protein [Bacillus sp. RAR_GA_16]|uniref:hypothetical protein n=1 Tax=Bacillus sp. RAR_GA_16 TaxID=2876774 RepID=UPI001CCAC1A1|nr:hypothetical protein [Bacillus sp. RAR_GA_16]MCA0174518.1 hypothetical protein [Bacillus sp. RAR_GA_16]
MLLLTTGPIENSLQNGTRTTKRVLIKIVNSSDVNTSTVEIVGTNLTANQIVYVSELITIPVNSVISKDYYADLDGFQFSFHISGLALSQTGISVWGKSDGVIQATHRLVLSELKIN